MSITITTPIDLANVLIFGGRVAVPNDTSEPVTVHPRCDSYTASEFDASAPCPRAVWDAWARMYVTRCSVKHFTTCDVFDITRPPVTKPAPARHDGV
jgi:hypothetical protein